MVKDLFDSAYKYLSLFSELDLRVDKRITLKELKRKISLVISVPPDMFRVSRILRIYGFIYSFKNTILRRKELWVLHK